MEPYRARLAHLILLGIVFLSLSLMLWASFTDSAIMDELAHIPAGYGYVYNLDYRLNPEHPPLVKTLAAAPLFILQPRFPAESRDWQSEVNGQWAMGTQFLYESQNDADALIRVARAGPILLTLFLILLTYYWARELVGSLWALLPTALLALSPSILAHGHYVTTDIGAAFGVVVATYFFIKFLMNPARNNLLYTGLAFGVAQIAKFSAVLLIPYFVFLLLVFFAKNTIRDFRETDSRVRARRFLRRAWHYLRSLILIFMIGYLLVVYPIYALFSINYPLEKQAGDTKFILQSFANGPGAFDACFSKTESLEIKAPCNLKRGIADLTIAMANHNLTRPLANYALGVLMVLQRSAGGNTGYFLGEVSSAGWKSYFPIVYILKEPIPVLFMILIALAASSMGIIHTLRKRGLKFLDYLDINFSEFAMLVFVIFYWVYSIRSPLNIGFRHLFPTLPFLYILTASGLKRWASIPERPEGFTSPFEVMRLWIRNIFTHYLKLSFIALLVVWFLIETAATAPYFLSYFNEFGGGVWNGYRYVTDSNYDW